MLPEMIVPPVAWPVGALGRGWRWLMASLPPSRRATAERTASPSHADEDECKRSMRSVLETQIIPRLLAVRQDAVPATELPRPAQAVTAGDIEQLARLCAAGQRDAVVALVGRLRAQGLGLDDVLVDLIGPAALWLGRRWEDDLLGFTEVTLGLVLLHELIHGMGYENHEGPQSIGDVRRIMLASAPGSQHVLGLSIVSEFFRKAGWQVVVEISSSRQALSHAVRNEWFDVVGLSVALDGQLPALADLIGEIRARSLHRDVPVLLGGPIFGLRHLEPAAFGAQAICLEARQAVRTAQSLLAR